MALSLSPLIPFGTSTWTYEGWQGQVYKKQYAKGSTVAKWKNGKIVHERFYYDTGSKK